MRAHDHDDQGAIGPAGPVTRADTRNPLARHGVPEAGPEPSSAEDGAVRRVIVIERSSGVQVGRENDQYSVYRVALPELEIQSPQELAEALLEDGTPWASDIFIHEAPRLRFNRPSGGRGSGTHRISDAAAEGDTLVIVRDSCGVEIGDHNVQRNQFRISADRVEVQVGGLEPTAERAELVSWLCADPGDQAAARALAENVAEAATIDLEAELTAEIADMMGSSQIEGWPGAVRDRTGVQIGEGNEADVAVRVNVLSWDAAVLELAGRILDAAETLEPSRSATPDGTARTLETGVVAQADLEAEIEGPELSL